MNYPGWLAIGLGVLIAAGGVRALRTGTAHTDAGFENQRGGAAFLLGWFWIALGCIIIAAEVFHVQSLRVLLRYVLEQG